MARSFLSLDYPTPKPEPVLRLYCLHCGREVTESTDDRCPSCQQSFDRKRLRHWATASGLPLSFRDDPPRSLVAWLGRLPVVTSLFRPSQLGRTLPPGAKAWVAFLYALVMHLLAAGLASLHYLAFRRYSMAAIVACGVVVCPLFCELLIAWLLGAHVSARGVEPTAQPRFWRTVCFCCSTHLCLTTGILAVMRLLVRRVGAIVSVYLFVALPVVPVMTTLWWWNSLGRAVLARGSASMGRTTVIFLIPVIGVAAALLFINGMIVALYEPR